MSPSIPSKLRKKGFLALIMPVLLAGWLALTICTAAAQTGNGVSIKQWRVDDTLRQAMVYVPATAKTQPTPVIFVFHGHGGSMQNMFKQRRFRELWPEAIIIAPQGLNTVGQLTDPDGSQPGWQRTPGDQHDRDLHFFDAMLHDLQSQYNIDPLRIYATGHSNGGSFVYLLWAARGNVLAAVAPSAAIARPFIINQLKPKPVLHMVGKQDPLVKPAWQWLTINSIQQVNQCQTTGQPYANLATLYPSAVNAPVVVYEHPGTHVYPADADAVVIQFFKSIKKPATPN